MNKKPRRLPGVGVALTTNGRCIPLLRFIIQEWLRLGAEVVVATNRPAANALKSFPIDVVVYDVSPAGHGDAMQAAFERVRSPYLMTGADDRLPVGPGWMDGLPRIPGSIAAIRLLSVIGQRYYDWAVHTNGRSELQPYSKHAPDTYITGGAQLISPEVRAALSYRNRPFRTAGDVQYCFDAVAAGFKLVAPNEKTPIMIHLDR
jgi:hypothetical protein